MINTRLNPFNDDDQRRISDFFSSDDQKHFFDILKREKTLEKNNQHNIKLYHANCPKCGTYSAYWLFDCGHILCSQCLYDSLNQRNRIDCCQCNLTSVTYI